MRKSLIDKIEKEDKKGKFFDYLSEDPLFEEEDDIYFTEEEE